MRKSNASAIWLAIATVAGVFLAPGIARAQQQVQFKAADGVTVYGAYYAATNSSRPMILLFHQAGSNHFEYAPIAPKLVAAEFSCLATDQRWGGEMWKETNQTVKKLGHAETAADKVTDLEADLEGALSWAHAKDPHRKFILWGSSYSASLVFVVASRHPDEVAGVLSFSPGEYFDEYPTMIEDAAMKVHASVFITSENETDRVEEATKIFNAVASRNKVHYKAQFAVHGSSTLRTDRNPKGAATNWAAVMKFLKQFER